MDDLRDFEGRVAGVVVRGMGPSEPVDDAAIFRAITTARSPRSRFLPLFGAAKFVVVIVALFGGFLLVSQPLDQLGATAPGASSESALPPVTGPAGNGLIAFSRDGDIFVGDPVTGVSEAIVAGPETDTSPVFSPDGTHIAFMRTHRTATEIDHGDFDIIVVAADGSDERVITPEGFEGWFENAWTPDGAWVVVSVDWKPVLLDAAGVAAPRSLPLPGHPGAPYGLNVHGGVAWLFRPPTADRILADDWLGGPLLTVMDPDGENVLDLGELSGLGGRSSPSGQDPPGGYSFVVSPAWSPDASMIALAAGEGRHLYVMDADGTDLRRLEGLYSGDFAWSPDGSSIATVQWSRVEPGSTDGCEDNWYTDFCVSSEWITTIDVATGVDRDLEAARLPNPGVADPTRYGPAIGGWSWSPDGREILMHGEPGTRPFVIDLASDTATELPWESDSIPSWQRVAAD